MADLSFLLHQRMVLSRQHQSKGTGIPAQQRLYEALREAILHGVLLPGAVLTSSRELGHELRMARNSVIHAYEQLAAEGYVCTSRQGTVVAALRAAPSLASAHTKRAHPLPALAKRVDACHRLHNPQDDLRPLRPGMPALDAFPMRTWQRLQERAAKSCVSADLGYRAAAGEPELRQAIATYLRAARGVRCHADQVIVTDGTQNSLSLCAHVLADAGEHAWIEHPGYMGAHTALRQAGLKLMPVTVDADGINPPAAWWRQCPPRLIYTTPSHQYPLGSVLTLSRRLALIEQARVHGSWILEDDYDSEFRHDGPPLAAMQGLVDDAPVVYLGTFSKTLFPALRLGFMVWPNPMADRIHCVANDLMRQGRTSEQRALAAFISEGHFTHHVRKMRRLYATRQAALREALAVHWPLPGAVLGGQAGMHLVLGMGLPSKQTVSDQALAQAAFARGLHPRPLSAYSTGGIAGFNGLVMGYANTHEDAMGRHIQSLANALASCQGS